MWSNSGKVGCNTVGWLNNSSKAKCVLFIGVVTVYHLHHSACMPLHGCLQAWAKVGTYTSLHKAKIDNECVLFFVQTSYHIDLW